jgi:tetratricopeptide (TPR) repeat protein
MVLLLLCGGCATYTDAVGRVYQAADAGDYRTGIDRLNRLLDVENAEQLPEKWTASRSLAVLERAVLLQATGQYKQSARDLSAAEAELELLDLKSDPVGTIGKYVYSDSAQTYKTPPTERLALSALNMVNYLVLGDLEGAAVEARRFTVSRSYLESLDRTVHGAFGSYLAGFVFEKRGEPERALRYYEEALDAGNLETLHEPILRLSQHAEYRGPKLRSYLDGVQAAHGDAGEQQPVGAEADGEVLIVLGLGRVPYKVPQRIPVGAAVGMAGVNATGDPKLLAALALKVIVYPELVTPDSLVTNAAVTVDGRSVAADEVTDLGNEVAREYESLKPQIIASALTRMLARAGAAEAARRAPKKADESTRWLAALATEAALLGLDKPDTRSWTFLPAHVCLCRAQVRPGRHELRVELQGRIRESRVVQVDVPPEGFCVAAVMEPR